MKWIIIVALIAVLGALASAGVFMLKRGGNEGERDKRMARALAWRVGLSVALFAFILFSWFMGWIAPTGVPMTR